MSNHGLNLEKEQQDQRGDEWVFGALSQPCIASIPEEARESCLPTGETQRGTEDTQDCASRSVINIAEAKLTYLYRNNKLTPDNKSFLEDNGYIKDNRVLLSDRYIAIKSGTTRQGNSLKAPLDAFRKLGTVPKHQLPLEPGMTWEMYHDPKAITREHDKLASQLASRFTWNYEQVYAEHFADADDFLDVGLYAWPTPTNGVYPRTERQENHAVALYKPRYSIFDNYPETEGDYIKLLASDYRFFNYGYRLYLSSQTMQQTSVTSQLIAIYQKLIPLLVMVRDLLLKETAPEPKPVPPNNLLNTMCLAIQKHEGWYEGSRSWRNRNPGNLVFVGQKGATKEPNGRFAVFATYEDGFQALKNMVLNAAKGKSKVYTPDMNLYAFFHTYAPPSDNNDANRYAEVVAKAMNVNPASFTLKQLL